MTIKIIGATVAALSVFTAGANANWDPAMSSRDREIITQSSRLVLPTPNPVRQMHLAFDPAMTQRDRELQTHQERYLADSAIGTNDTTYERRPNRLDPSFDSRDYELEQLNNRAWGQNN